jgi:hypothetical protein
MQDILNTIVVPSRRDTVKIQPKCEEMILDSNNCFKNLVKMQLNTMIKRK